jgi:O-antigen/teichoic acid export membrane protein
MTRKLLRVWYISVAVVALMILFSTQVYKFWIGSDISIPLNLSILMGIYVLILTWDSIFISFINGIGKVKLQLYLAVFAGIVFIPLGIFFGKNFGLDVSGVLLAICIVLIPGAFLIPLQYRKIIKKTAEGIWNK